jgi:hypothetical protein
MESYIPKQVNISEDKKETKKPVKNSVKSSDKVKNVKTKKIEGNFFTFKLDDDVYNYIKNIDTILIIDSVMQGKVNKKTKTDYINDLIRDDLKKRLNIKASEQDSSKWIDAYNEYAKKYGLDK